MIIKVHQSLHGYSDGHRQLACSATLSPRDAKLVLVMSDVSGAGVASEGSSYLTGYPLQDTGMYALAQTWSATEMPRPGCVWTHTLFIEYPDLATVSAPSCLAKLFIRPDSPSWSSYGVPSSMDLNDDKEEPRFSPQDEDWLATVLNALYQFPQERVVAKRDPAVSAEALTLRIWDQQWPRLRRSFRFCTFTTKDRSASGAAFDLQVLPDSASSNRTRLPGTHEATPLVGNCHADWLTTLMNDARQPNLSGLRDTMKKLGADILGGREAMPTLCELHRLTSGLASPSVLGDAIGMLNSPGLLTSSDLARAQVADYVLSNVEVADQPALAFLWDNWQFIEPTRLQKRLPVVAGALWRASPQRLLVALRDQADKSAEWAVQVVKAMHADDFIEDWPNGDMPLRKLLEIRPDLLNMTTFWVLQEARSFNELLGIELSDQSVQAMLRGVEGEPAMRAVVQLLGAQRVLDALQMRSRSGDWESNELQWTQYCVRDASVIAEFLSRVEAPSVPLLLALIGILQPDAVPNHYGDDPWYTALFKVRNEMGSLPQGLAAFGFARALGWSSRNIAELLQLTFEQLQGSASNSTLDDVHWRLIEQRLPWAPEEKRWDRAWRLRATVAGLFIERRLWPSAFAWTATNDDVFVALMEEVAGRWGGRRFLKKVEESLENEHDAPTHARRELIRWFLRSRSRR